MSEQVKLIVIIALAIILFISVLLLINNGRKNKLKKKIEELNVRFNGLKTVPLAFKLNKAQAMAKRNEKTAEEVKTYYQKYEEAQKHIDSISEMLMNVDDFMASKSFKQAKSELVIIEENINDSEKEVNDIDEFLERFSKEENILRQSATGLKEIFRELKLYFNDHGNQFTIAYDGLSKKIEEIEDLFSQSEEFLYINDYEHGEEYLDKIDASLEALRLSMRQLPSLIDAAKGVVPSLVDEVVRQYALTRQRGVYSEHLHIDDHLLEIQRNLNSDVKTLNAGQTGEVALHCEKARVELRQILDDLANENQSFSKIKELNEQCEKNIGELKNLYEYVLAAYNKDRERFGIKDIDVLLEQEKEKIGRYVSDYIELNNEVSANNIPASQLVNRVNILCDEISSDHLLLTSYKGIFDKNTSDEKRAREQLMKLQVVLNEVEVKVREYRLPSIADSYHDDLLAGRQRIFKIKELLAQMPIDLPMLNATLDEAIDYIYKFYNNVNNVVGMAIMVENAIVYGNRYRSSFPEVERDLSKAEFSYLNGEYTKALTMAIACMERLFPDKKNTDYLKS